MAGNYLHFSFIITICLAINQGAAQIFIGDESIPAILYSPLPLENDDGTVDIIDLHYELIHLSSNEARPKHIDYDPQEQMIYWASFENQIGRILLDGTNEEIIIDGDILGNPAGFAVDPVNRKLYWTGYNSQTVNRANLDGTDIEELLHYDGFVQPTAVAVNPEKGNVFHTKRLQREVIRSPLDLSNSTVVLQDASAKSLHLENCPDGTTRIYYLEDYFTVGIGNADGSGQRIIYNELRDTMEGNGIGRLGPYLIWAGSEKDSYDDPNRDYVYIYDMEKDMMAEVYNTTTLTNGSVIEITPISIRVVSEPSDDKDPPIIKNCPRDITVTLDDTNVTSVDQAPVCWKEPSVLDTRTCAILTLEGNVTRGGNFPVGETKVSYRATDAAGNTATCTFKVTVQLASEKANNAAFQITPDPHSGGAAMDLAPVLLALSLVFFFLDNVYG